MRRYAYLILLLLFGPVQVLGSTIAAAPATAYAQSADLDQQAREIGADLRCPVCQNLSVADSPSPLASEMRAIIRRKLAAGEPRQVIMQYFVDAYGASVLLNPPQQGFTLLVWLGAAAAVVGGAALLALRLRKALAPQSANKAPDVTTRPDKTRPAPVENDSYEAAYEVALDTELEQYKRGSRL